MYSRNFPRKTWFTAVESATTIAIVTPSTSARVVIDGIVISNNGAAGTFVIAPGYVSKSLLACITVGASATVSPYIGEIEVKEFDRAIYFAPSTGSTNGCYVTLTGFELKQ